MAWLVEFVVVAYFVHVAGFFGGCVVIMFITLNSVESRFLLAFLDDASFTSAYASFKSQLFIDKYFKKCGLCQVY